MEAIKSIQNDGIPDSHYFSYNEKLFPIKYDFFKYASVYFQKNENLIKANKIIQLISKEEDGDLCLSDSSIQDFIDFVQNKSIILSNQNVSALNFLSKKYIVNNLAKFTEQYIDEHHEDIILQILIKQNDSQIDTHTYEDILSSHFLDYINNDQLLNLKFNILYRIITNYLHQNNSNSAETDEFIKFLFKCLDKYGRDASILFSDIDLNKSDSKYLKLLLEDYSEIFDFHFLNPVLIRSLYEIESKKLGKLIDVKSEENEYHQKVENMFQKINQEIAQMKTSYTNQINEQKQMLNQNNSTCKTDLQNMRNEMQKINQEIAQMKGSFANRIDEQKQMINQNDSSYKNDFQNMRNEMQKINQEIAQMKDSYTKESNEQMQMLNQNNSSYKNDFQNMRNEMQKINQEVTQLKASYAKELSEQKKILNQNDNTEKSIQSGILKINQEIAQIKDSYSKELNEQKQLLNQNISTQKSNLQQIANGIEQIKNAQGTKQAQNEKEINDLKNELKSIKESISKINTSHRKVKAKQSTMKQSTPSQPSLTNHLSRIRDLSDNNRENSNIDDLISPLPFNLSTSSLMTSVEPVCTYVASGRNGIIQKWYHCKTCDLTGSKGMCEVCALRCHKGHNISCEGEAFGAFCDCPIKCNCKCSPNSMNTTCTFDLYRGKPINQPMYKCLECSGSLIICQNCAIKFHHEHNLVYLGIVSSKTCQNKGNLMSKSMIMPKRSIFSDDE